MSEFDKFWGDFPDKTECSEAIARRIWRKAQSSLTLTLQDPPYLPKVGETVRLRSLCHPRLEGREVEVTAVEARDLAVYDVDIRYPDAETGETMGSGGWLGEVEFVREKENT